jgi:YHS domain-containing protein
MRCACRHRHVAFACIFAMVLLASAVISIAAGPASSSDGAGGAKPQAAEAVQSGWAGDPWPLDTCIVAGEKLGPLSEQVIDVHEGREVRTCCKNCLTKFKAEPEKYLKAADEAIIAEQLPHYPLKTCVVETADVLPAGAHGEAVNVVYKNRLVRLCCKGCVKPFMEAPGPSIELLNAAVITQQKDAYPLTTCVVDNLKLGERGPTVEYVMGDTLVRLCCTGCVDEFKRNPTVYVARIRMAWTDKSQGH